MILPEILHHVAYNGKGLGIPLLCPEDRIHLIDSSLMLCATSLRNGISTPFPTHVRIRICDNCTSPARYFTTIQGLGNKPRGTGTGSLTNDTVGCSCKGHANCGNGQDPGGTGTIWSVETIQIDFLLGLHSVTDSRVLVPSRTSVLSPKDGAFVPLLTRKA